MTQQIIGYAIPGIVFMACFTALDRCRPWIFRLAVMLERLKHGHDSDVEVTAMDVRMIQVVLAALLMAPVFVTVFIAVSGIRHLWLISN